MNDPCAHAQSCYRRRDAKLRSYAIALQQLYRASVALMVDDSTTLRLNACQVLSRVATVSMSSPSAVGLFAKPSKFWLSNCARPIIRVARLSKVEEGVGILKRDDFNFGEGLHTRLTTTNYVL